MLGFLGTRGTDDWVTDQRPKSWREQIAFLYPNGLAPLTALTTAMPSDPVTDPEFNWWTQTIEMATGDVTGVFTDALVTAYVSGGVTGDTLYVQMSATDAAFLVAGSVILLRDASAYDMTALARVTSVTVNGANSYAVVTLLEDDDNGSATGLSDADGFIVVGSAYEEGTTIPDAKAYSPTKYTNYTQIFRNALSITGTALETVLRTKPQEYQKLKMEALKMHSIEMELAFWFGIPYETTGSGGKPQRTTGGLLNFIKSNSYALANNVSDYSTDDTIDGGAYNGVTWTASGGGIDWMNSMFERAFRYGGGERIAFCGNQALLGVQRLVAAHGTMNLQPVVGKWGFKVLEWVTPFGTVYLKTHPLWNREDIYRNMMVLIEPENLRYRYIKNRDTKFYPDKDGNNAGNRVDGKTEEFLTEAGLEMHHPETCAILYGVGQDNA